MISLPEELYASQHMAAIVLIRMRFGGYGPDCSLTKVTAALAPGIEPDRLQAK
jgi:hypothetical protein